MSRSPRRSKIVATLGPASSEPETVSQLIEAGVDVFRLNLAHHDPEADSKTVKVVRECAAAAGRCVPILMDLPGPKMRTGPVRDLAELRPGERFVLTEKPVVGDETQVSTTIPDLADIVHPGDTIYLADGEVILRVTGISALDVVTEVIRGGLLSSRKGLFVPAAEERVEAFTADDAERLRFAVEQGADFVGLSFVRNGGDVQRARSEAAKHGEQPAMVAKIETGAAVRNLDSIIDTADAVMVARGDLGVQLPLPEIPYLQKRIIGACLERAVPVITATQMLESMTRSPLPTRAEVTDVANAVLDGTDALMLSEETAVGRNPVEAVKAMAGIATVADLHGGRVNGGEHANDIPWAVSRAAVGLAREVGAAAICCPTQTGGTARTIAAFRPRVPVLAFTPRPATVARLALVWGTVPFPANADGRSWTVHEMIREARQSGHARTGSVMVMVSGPPGNFPGGTNVLRVVRV